MNTFKLAIVLVISGLCNWINASTDTLAMKSPVLTVRLVPYPILYGTLHGYGIVGQVERNLYKKQYLNAGLKYIQYEDMGGYMGAKHSVFTLEYRKYHSENLNRKKYFAPYIKIRDLSYWEYESGGINKNYTENSIGIGFNIGKVKYLNKKHSLEMNTFIGGGYFIRFNKKGEINTYNRYIGKFDPKDIILFNLDLRLGVIFGINIGS